MGSTSKYPLSLTGRQVDVALRKMYTYNLAESPIIHITSDADSRFNPDTLHTPGIFSIDYVGSDDLPDVILRTHPVLIRIITEDLTEDTVRVIQVISSSNSDFIRTSDDNGETWTAWDILYAAMDQSQIDVITTEDINNLIDSLNSEMEVS